MPVEKKYKERRLWYFICGCGGRAQSHRRKNAIDEKCRKCRRLALTENYPSLFDQPENVRINGEGNTESDPRVS